MKMVIAMIPHSKLEDVKNELNKVEVTRMTVNDVRGFGRQKGHTEIIRGREIQINFVSKLEIKIAVNDEFLEPTIEAIKKGSYTGKAGDGKIFVMPLEQVHRISTKEEGTKAI